MVYTTAIAAPPRFQWETSSQYSQAHNCGPTSVTRIACFYRDTYLGIEATRKTIAGMGPYNVNGLSYYGAPPGTATNAWQQKDMLEKRGVPASVRQIDSLAEMHGLVDSGRRPILVGIEMSRVDSQVRGHNFGGWHAVVIVGPAFVNGLRGVYINDPNFNVPGSWGADPTKGRRFYSDAILQGAWISNSPRYCVVPDQPKVIASPPLPSGELPVDFTSRYGWEATIIAGKPRRAGRSLTNTDFGASPTDQAFHIIAEVVGQNFGSGSRWFVGAQYIKSKWRWVFCPLVDLKGRNF
jgi:hypothetical protein